MTSHHHTSTIRGSDTAAPSSMRLLLAPMEGVVDAIMRDMLTTIGGYDRCVTEFVRVSQTVLPRRVFLRLCPELATEGHTRSGVPVFVQLLGSDPELMAKNAQVAAGLGAPGIDLNFGCPAKTVNKSEGGAALLRCPEKILAVCQAVRDAVPHSTPVTAKIRLGFDSDDNFENIARCIVATGVSELVVHARTRKQGYKPPAHWHRLAALQPRPAIPLICNGELWSPSDVAIAREASGCRDFMLARGALCRPDLALAVRAAQAGQPYEAMTWTDVEPLLLSYLCSNGTTYEPRYAVNPLKQWLVYLQHHYPQAGLLFSVVKRIKSYDDMAAALRNPSAATAKHEPINSAA